MKVVNNIAHSFNFKFPSGIEITCRGSQEFANKIYEEVKPLLRKYVALNSAPHQPEEQQRPIIQPGTKKPYKSPVMYEHIRQPIVRLKEEDQSGEQ